jgi:hypothetical protein
MIQGYDYYLRYNTPIVYHIIWGLDGSGPAWENTNYTKASGWYTCVVLPRQVEASIPKAGLCHTTIIP